MEGDALIRIDGKFHIYKNNDKIGFVAYELNELDRRFRIHITDPPAEGFTSVELTFIGNFIKVHEE